MGEPRPLPGSFYRKGTAEVARALLGCRLTRRFPDGSVRSVILVETEAYLGAKDRAAHTWNGRRTPRVEPMWGPGGHAYVYFVYGMHFCMNVVTQRRGRPRGGSAESGDSGNTGDTGNFFEGEESRGIAAARMRQRRSAGQPAAGAPLHLLRRSPVPTVFSSPPVPRSSARISA